MATYYIECVDRRTGQTVLVPCKPEGNSGGTKITAIILGFVGTAIVAPIVGVLAQNFAFKQPASVPSATEVRPSVSADPCSGAEAHWHLAEASGTRSAFQNHVIRYRNCAFASIAQNYVKQLDDEARELAQQEFQRRQEKAAREQLQRQREADESRNRIDQERAAADTERARVAREQAAREQTARAARTNFASGSILEGVRSVPPSQSASQTAQYTDGASQWVWNGYYWILPSQPSLNSEVCQNEGCLGWCYEANSSQTLSQTQPKFRFEIPKFRFEIEGSERL
jgi:hypothetical protein